MKLLFLCLVSLFDTIIASPFDNSILRLASTNTTALASIPLSLPNLQNWPSLPFREGILGRSDLSLSITSGGNLQIAHQVFDDLNALIEYMESRYGPAERIAFYRQKFRSLVFTLRADEGIGNIDRQTFVLVLGTVWDIFYRCGPRWIDSEIESEDGILWYFDLIWDRFGK